MKLTSDDEEVAVGCLFACCMYFCFCFVFFTASMLFFFPLNPKIYR